jgi:dihydrofolate reductase
MRKLIVVNLMSLDGFMAGPDDDLSVMPFGPGFSEYNLERLQRASTLLVGRKSFENFRAHWPSVADDPTQPEGERAISRLNNAIEKVVVTSTLREGDLQWSPSRTIQPEQLGKEVRKLKEAEGNDIIVFGSHQLWNELLKIGLVDELHIMVGPGSIGSGIAAFQDSAPAKLKLMETRKLDDAGVVLLAYAVENEVSA